METIIIDDESDRKRVIILNIIKVGIGKMGIIYKTVLQQNFLVIGAVFMDLNTPFIVELNDIIKRIVEENGDTLISFDAALDQERQDEQIKMLIEYGVDAILLIPVDWITVKPALEAVKEAGIPVFNIDRPVKDIDLVESVIVEDNYNAGILNAAYMMQVMNSAKIGIIERPTVSSAIARINGFLDTIEWYPQYEVVARGNTGGHIEDAIPVTKELISEHPEINAIMTSDDVAARGIVIALQDMGRGDVAIFSVDASPEGKRMIREGLITASAALTPNTIGAVAVNTVYASLSGKDIEKYITVPVFLVNIYNVNQYGIGWEKFDLSKNFAITAR